MGLIIGRVSLFLHVSTKQTKKYFKSLSSLSLFSPWKMACQYLALNSNNGKVDFAQLPEN